MLRLSPVPLLIVIGACASPPPTEASPAPRSPSAPASGDAPAPAPPTPSGAAPAASASAPTTAPSAAPAEVPPLSKPKSVWSVGGVSLSEIDALELAGAFKKAKLTDSGSAGGSMGKGYESVGFPLAKGKAKGRFYMVRPAKGPTPAESSLGSPEVALGMKDKDKAFGVHDATADLYFEIRIDEGGKASDAQQWLNAVIREQKPKK